MLLPDQTYEQYQDVSAPLLALKRMLFNIDSRPQIEIECNGKYCVENSDENVSCSQNTSDNLAISTRNDAGETEKFQSTETVEEARVDTPENYEQISEFFNNVPEYTGQPLGPFSIPQTDEDSKKNRADLLKECELFLYKHRIRPDFFCRYRRVLQ